ncbi:MAG: Gfo/Idh/MocA family oxidoreductase [Planctomycetota bacterium]|nr:Gfo/Idh/MocA family oxidoreductase [Planctomycetota bacterium]
MNKVRIGLIGYGSMGSLHAKYLISDEVPSAELVAVCDSNTERLEQAEKNLGGGVELFDNAEKLFAAGLVEAVLITTPHYLHPQMAIQAFKHKLHVLIEKPAGVYTKQVREMNEAAAGSGKVFAIMFNQRTRPIHQKLKDLVASGELGPIKRTNWISTAWYRTQSYYDSGSWRATWSGEGGGVLLNQCPHQLDLWQWICGMPKRVQAFCGFGKYHDIEVEDDVTAYVEYKNGATGLFVASTGEAPGTNRLEIVGDNGKVVMEEGKLTFWRTCISERKFNREHKGGFGEPECRKCKIPVPCNGNEHKDLTKNWVQAILDGTPLLAKGDEGIHSLELSNAMLLSSWTDNWVELPIDDDLFYEKLQERLKTSTSKKKQGLKTSLNVSGSFK